GFSLLETLIATGVLIVVVMGVMSLSNSLIVGTVVNADKTIINRWASEGIELTQKIRDDRILDKSTSPNWFEQAVASNGSDYGWYRLSSDTVNTWKLDKIIGVNPNTLTSLEFTNETIGEKLTSDVTIGFRLICVESVATNAISTNDGQFQCNTTPDGNTLLLDGLRTDPGATSCQIGEPGEPNDLYCQMTKDSINKNRVDSLEDKIIPSGNAVKVRSVVVWQDKDQYRSSSMATLLTNWKGYEQ
ncbi:MAG: hypothetical protein AAB613_01705, partial [Patescibacteria group bacterium]